MRSQAAITNKGCWITWISLILFPPISVFIHYGCGSKFWISFVLTLCLYLPGLIYSILIVIVWLDEDKKNSGIF